MGLTTIRYPIYYNVTGLSSEVSSDISAHSGYLPYTNIDVNDNTRPENENSENQSNDNTQEGDDDPGNQVIQVIVGNRTEGWNINKAHPNEWRMRSNNITVKRDNRLLLANKLPTVFVTNHRSFFPKFSNFVDMMQTRGLTLGQGYTRKYGKIKKRKNTKTK